MLHHVHDVTINVSRSKVNQKFLGRVLLELFPNEKILENTRNLVHKEIGISLQLDFWIPSLKLAVEFQGPHHYTTAWYSPFTRQKWENRDSAKKKVSEEKGITIVDVPYWWQGDKKSLIATIREKRKDLFPEMEGLALPISSDFASFGSYKPSTIPDVGELMNVNFVYNKNSLLAPWWTSEKYDGVRACWNPSKYRLYGRWGREIAVQDVFLLNFPKLLLDGELWFGRGNFKDSHALVVLSTRPDALSLPPLELLRFAAFDSPPPSPSPSSSSLFSSPSPSSSSPEIVDSPSIFSSLLSYAKDSDPFEARTKLVNDSVSTDHPFITPIANCKSYSRHQLKIMLEDMWKGQGEGLVLHGPKSVYTKGNSDEVLKLKGLVMQVHNNSVNLQLSNGEVVTAQIPQDVPGLEIGDVVTYSYILTVKGNISNPKILRKRSDVRWDDLVSREKFHEGNKQKVMPRKGKAHEKGYFRSEDGKNVRIFFEKFAATRNFDPLVAENWYHLTFADIVSAPGGAAVLSIHNNCWSRALLATFPDIGLDVFKFKRLPQSYWKDPLNMREYLIEFAKSKNFDPFVADNWYDFSSREYKKFAKFGSLVENYGIMRMLKSALPNVHFDSSKFTGAVRWRAKANRKKFFDSIADSFAFDPLVMKNWYAKHKQITGRIREGTGRSMFDRFYNSDLHKALHDLYH